MQKAIVITSIHGKTPAMEAYEKMDGWHVIVVGDKKSMPMESSESLTYLSIGDQKKLGFAYEKLCPKNHYARKNIGYLYALREGAEMIFDTDDDNLPLPQWNVPEAEGLLVGNSVVGFANVYAYFGNAFCWPRGFPLDLLHDESMRVGPMKERVTVGVWQSLAESDPDVDAVFRMVFPGSVTFRSEPHLVLDAGTYCPLNSQATFWSRDALPFLYLPSTVSFRFTDIMRGYVAQRLLWNKGCRVAFSAPLVQQVRNKHDLMDDFALEVPCQLGVRPVARLLNGMKLGVDVFANVRSAYTVLAEAGYVGDGEIAACEAWLSDAETIMRERI